MAFDTHAKEFEELLELNVTEDRLSHILSVKKYAKDLCTHHHLEFEPVEVAVYAHDLFRDWKIESLITVSKNWKIENPYFLQEPILYHGIIAGIFIQKRFGTVGIYRDIIEAVSYHTCGYPFRSYIGKVLFIADALEDHRRYRGVEKIRKLSFKHLEEAFKEVVRYKILYILKENYMLLPQTVLTWNSFQDQKYRKE